MCRSLIFNADLIGMCVFQHIFKMSTKLHNCCVMYKIDFWLSKSAYCNNICIINWIYAYSHSKDIIK